MKKKHEVEIRNLNKNDHIEAAVEDLGEKINDLCRIYDISISVHALTSLVLNYAVKAEIDKKMFMQAMDQGFDVIEKSLKEKLRK